MIWWRFNNFIGGRDVCLLVGWGGGGVIIISWIKGYLINLCWDEILNVFVLKMGEDLKDRMFSFWF